MAEYISKDELMQYLKPLTNKPAIVIKRYVEDMPAADVQPVKRGRWIGIYEYCEKNGYVPSGMGIYYWCSECDKAEKKTSVFCPHCGADMRTNKI